MLTTTGWITFPRLMISIGLLAALRLAANDPAQFGGPPGGGGPGGPGGPGAPDIEVVDRFDHDKDKRLNTAERSEAREWLAGQQGQRRGGPGGPAVGGSGEEVVGGRGGRGGNARGGAISVFSTVHNSYTIQRSLISDQVVTAGRGGNGAQGADRLNDEEAFGGRGGQGGNGGHAVGGGMSFEYFQSNSAFPEKDGLVSISDTVVSRNFMAAGDGGFGGTGGTTRGESIDSIVGGDGGNGGSGGDVSGGGIYFDSIDATINDSK